MTRILRLKQFWMVLMLPLISCATASDVGKESIYPENWPALVKRPENGCTNLSGEYAYYGEAQEKKGYSTKPIRMDQSLFGKILLLGEQKKVVIRHDPERNFLSYQNPEGNQPEKLFQVSCLNNQNIIKRESTVASSEGSSDTIYTIELAKAIDGSLAAFISAVSVYKLFFIPLKQNFKGWVRFLPAGN